MTDIAEPQPQHVATEKPADNDERPKAMLDVHAPHAGIHSWKDFFIHIATITIGLLIAIGLEQGVEYIHHLGQLQTARQELAVELDLNRVIARGDADSIARIEPQLESDMALLRAARESQKPFAGKLDYARTFRSPRAAVWQSLQQSGTLVLMPHAELQKYAYFYQVSADFYDAMKVASAQMDIADAIARRSPDGNLSAKDIDDLIAATSDAQGKIAFMKRLSQFVDAGIEQAQ